MNNKEKIILAVVIIFLVAIQQQVVGLSPRLTYSNYKAGYKTRKIEIKPKCPECQTCQCPKTYKTELRECQEKYSRFEGLDKVMKLTAKAEYKNGEYDCKHFSRALRQRARKVGVEGAVIKGRYNGGQMHAVYGILIEPQTGEFINPDEKFIPQGFYINNLANFTPRP